MTPSRSKASIDFMRSIARGHARPLAGSGPGHDQGVFAAAVIVAAHAVFGEAEGAVEADGGLVFAAVGGCMVPPEVFPPIMQTISRFTPHAWALDGLRALAVNDANLFGVLPQVGVLAAFAVVLLSLATWRLRAALTG